MSTQVFMSYIGVQSNQEHVALLDRAGIRLTR